MSVGNPCGCWCCCHEQHDSKGTGEALIVGQSIAVEYITLVSRLGQTLMTTDHGPYNPEWSPDNTPIPNTVLICIVTSAAFVPILLC